MSQVQENIRLHSDKFSSAFPHKDLALNPLKKFLLVTCHDARIDPAEAFAIAPGDAHVIRNVSLIWHSAGGSARDALRSIVISQQMMGTREIVLVRHTDCGTMKFQQQEILAIIKNSLGSGAIDELKRLGIDFLPFSDALEEVKADAAYLRNSGLIEKGTVISGWVYHVENGKTERIE